MKIKIGIIGIGSRIRSLIQIIESNWEDKFDFKIYEPDNKSKKIFEERFPKTNFKFCKKISEILENPEISWVIIGSPNNFHKEQILRCIKANKNIFSEKPLAISESELFEIKKEAAKMKNLSFLISYPLKKSPHYNKIKSLLQEKKIGEIISLEFNETLNFHHGSFIMSDWRRFEKISGGHLLEKCCHDLDLANWLIKSLPKKVSSFGGLNFFTQKNSSIFKKFKETGIDKEKMKKVKINPFSSKKDIVDNQVAIIEYLDGVRATFHTNCSSALPERRIYICGTKGTIRANLLTGEIELKEFLKQDSEIFSDTENAGGHGGGDFFLIKNLIEVVENKKIQIKDLDEAIQSALTALAIERARKKGEVVNLEKLWKKFGYY